ncbi:NAD(P)-binding protein, partial [Bimuria novae-zelandiae CBS 107.79]
LKGKVAIVTGSPRSIGAGIALELAKRGANVCLNTAQNEKQLLTVIKQLQNGNKAIIVQANHRQVDAPDRIVEATVKAFGPKIDILVNNAAVLFSKPLQKTTPDDFAAIFDVNVSAPLLVTKAAQPYLRAPGRIINISSVGARQGFETLAMHL